MVLGSTQELSSTLAQRFSKNLLHHGLIFQGDPIEIVESQAFKLSRFILGVPESSWEHPDLFHLRPSGKMRIISVEKTRTLISDLSRTSNQGGAKIALIHDADRMRKEAANAFLKTLEEPPPGTYLFLLTTRPNSMLATIKSRCLTVRLKKQKEPINKEDWLVWTQAYEAWILSLLDRKSLANDRTSPVFGAFGLTSGLLKIIHDNSDNESKKSIKSLTVIMDEKEKDAWETGVRKRVRAQFLCELADVTREIIIRNKNENLPMNELGPKLAKVVQNLEKNTRLMEVNLKDEAALEDFYLTSLRIWSSK
ncbi:MAG: hypothetical protein CMI27_02130 [Opitutae bacterium]|nr:hypothetical protein [Opitutae bacterium]